MDIFGMEIFSLRKGSSRGLEWAMRKYINEKMDTVNKKNNMDLDLLTKVKNYAVKRSALENAYGQSLQALRNQFGMNEAQYQDLGFSSQTSIYAIWNDYLEQIKRVGSAHLSLAQFYSQNMANNAKNAHTSKMETIRKRMEELKKCIQELVASSVYTEKYQKMYSEACSNVQSVNTTTTRGSSKHESKEYLEKRRMMRLVELEKAMEQARNLYLIRFEATKTHQNWFNNTAVPKYIQETEARLYESLWTWLSAAACIEIEQYNGAGRMFGMVSEKIKKVPNAEEHRQQFMRACHLLNNPQTLQFDGSLDTNACSIRATSANDPTLVEEARTWISSHIRAEKTTRAASEQLFQLENTSSPNKAYSDRNHSYETTKKNIDELKEEIRKAEINKLKADAILEKLRIAGVNMEEMANGTSATINKASSSYSSYFSQLSLICISQVPSEETSTPNGHQLYIVLYHYQPKNDDELRIFAGETLTVLEDPTDKAWPKAKNQHGQCGLVPCNYIEPANKANEITNKNRAHLVEVALNGNSQSVKEGQPNYCRAKYSYTARDKEELSFDAGDILEIIDETPHNVTDGWWKGKIVDRRKDNRKDASGTFPSMLVENISNFGSVAPYKVSSSTPHLSPTSCIDLSSSVTLRQNPIKNTERKSIQTWYADTVQNKEESRRVGLSEQRNLCKSSQHLNG